MNDQTRAYTTAALLQLVPSVLGAVSAAAQATGAKGAVSRYLDIAAALIGQGATAYKDLVVLKTTVQSMTAANREPTPYEWEVIEGRSNIAHAAIQSYDIEAEDDKPEGASEPQDAAGEGANRLKGEDGDGDKPEGSEA